MRKSTKGKTWDALMKDKSQLEQRRKQASLRVKGKTLEERYKTPEARANILNAFCMHQKGKKRSAESIAKQKKTRALRQAQGLYKAQAFHWSDEPNKFEAKALAIVNAQFNNSFTFTGNGSMMIDHRSPDAYSKEMNAVALFNGHYWHYRRFNFEFDPVLNRQSVELRDALPFIKAGYRTFIVWEDEMKIKEIVLDNSIDTEIAIAAALNFAFNNNVNKSYHNRQLLETLAEISQSKETHS